MPQTVEAIFENGTFRLLDASVVPLAEGQHVRLTVEAEVPSDDVLALAEQVYAGLSEADIDEIERVVLDRHSFFTDHSAAS